MREISKNFSDTFFKNVLSYKNKLISEYGSDGATIHDEIMVDLREQFRTFMTEEEMEKMANEYGQGKTGIDQHSRESTG